LAAAPNGRTCAAVEAGGRQGIAASLVTSLPRPAVKGGDERGVAGVLLGEASTDDAAERLRLRGLGRAALAKVRRELSDAALELRKRRAGKEPCGFQVEAMISRDEAA
jgi:hypothetical protein